MRSAVIFTALIGTLVGGTVLPGTASAAPRGNIVVLGDSFATNPPFFTNTGPGCHENPASWPRQLNAISGRRVDNFACANTSLYGQYNVYDQIKKATSRIGKNTDAVLIQLGFNDFGSGLEFLVNCFAAGCPGGESQFPRLTANNFVSRLKPLIDYVRYYAPKAKIAFVGYPELYGANQVDICVKLPAGVPVTRPGSSAHPAFMRKLDRVQAEAASRSNVGFIQLTGVTKGHGMCAQDAWITGFFHPFDGLDTRIEGHPTVRGDAVAARTVKRVLGL